MKNIPIVFLILVFCGCANSRSWLRRWNPAPIGLHLSPTPIVTKPYFVISPNLLRVGVEESVVVLLHGVTQPVNVDVEIMSDDKSQSKQKLKKMCQPDTPTSIRVKLGSGDVGDGGGISHVWLLVKSTDSHFLFSHEARVMVTRRVENVFLQLDKPIYHPDKKMHIRAFNVDEHLNPSDRTVRLEIKDPEGHVLWRDDKAPKPRNPGIIQFDPFHFPQIPTIGTWTATAYYGNKWQFKDEVNFEVKDYTLPRFDVSVAYDNIITPRSTQLTGKISARYTYGKPVVGRVDIFYSVVDPGITTKLFRETKQLDVKGSANFTMDLNIVKTAKLWFPTATKKKKVPTATLC